jgi:hypothetical protein
MSHKLKPYHSTVTEVFSSCNTPWFGELILVIMCAFVRKFITYYTQDTAMDYAGCFTASLKGYNSIANKLF